MQNYSVLASERYLLVDVNSSQQGLRVCGKQIHSPNLILQNRIKTVVICALSRKDEILAMLRDQYPPVEHVFIPAFEITDDGIVPVLQPVNQFRIRKTRKAAYES
ncbi:hypothetical protein SBDP1_760052 [Syntrophobacter sp. SbD1]|nr:hypothetical protein SBDP1_760052 [Syntrophobacter sp. SbD1]